MFVVVWDVSVYFVSIICNNSNPIIIHCTIYSSKGYKCTYCFLLNICMQLNLTNFFVFKISKLSKWIHKIEVSQYVFEGIKSKGQNYPKHMAVLRFWSQTLHFELLHPTRFNSGRNQSILDGSVKTWITALCITILQQLDKQ